MASNPSHRPFAQAPVIYLAMEQVSDRVGLRKSTIYELIRKGSFPVPQRFSPSTVRWDEAAIAAWIERIKEASGGR